MKLIAGTLVVAAGIGLGIASLVVVSGQDSHRVLPDQEDRALATGRDYEVLRVPGASMEPRLREGERVTVEVLSGQSVGPVRGDLIVFRDPFGDPCEERPGVALPEECRNGPVKRGYEPFDIKRIVGMPGETIEMWDGEIWVCPMPNCMPLNEDGTQRDGEKVEFESTMESGPQKDNYTMPPYRIPEDSYFVLGDNRGNSSDSRVFRSIPYDSILGIIVDS